MRTQNKTIKVVFLLVALIAVTALFASCGGSGFAIEGKWKNVGSTTYGQVQQGAIVVFDGSNCNMVSPSDTYAFYKNGDNYVLDCTLYLSSDTLSFTVKVVDNDHIQIYTGSGYLELTRVG